LLPYALCNDILCSKCMRGSPVTKRINTKCESERPFAVLKRYPPHCPPTSFACLVLLDGLFSRHRHADRHLTPCRDGGDRFLRLGWPALEPQLKHEAAHAETEAVSEDGCCCMSARCVITKHLADRRTKPRVACGRPRPHIYWVVQPVCRKSDPRP
jgi:hypothetical protein